MTKRILYIDDEADIREVAAMALELDPGFSVRTGGSGAEALTMAREWKPDLIMLDVMMPGMDGPITLASLRAAWMAAEYGSILPVEAPAMLAKPVSPAGGTEASDAGATADVPRLTRLSRRPAAPDLRDPR